MNILNRKPFSNIGLRILFGSGTGVLLCSTRAINATWTREMAHDIRALHNIDAEAEAELTTILSQQLAQALNEDIVNRIRGIDHLTWDIVPMSGVYINPYRITSYPPMTNRWINKPSVWGSVQFPIVNNIFT